MGLFSRKKSFTGTEIVNTSSFIPVSWLNTFLSSGPNVVDKKLLELFLSVPELQAIINTKATAFSNMHVLAVDKDGNEKDIPQAKIFTHPNPLQNFVEMASQYYILRSIFGNGFMHPVFGTDPKKGFFSLWNMPPLNAKVIPADSLVNPFNMTDLDEIIKRYEFQYNGMTLKYEPNEILHFNDNQVQFSDDKFLMGQSRITAISQACENIKSAYEARGILIQNSALGILSNDSKDQIGNAPLDPKDKEDLQKDYKKYGLSKSKWQLILTNAALKWQSMAVDVGKLKLFEEVDHDFRAIANQFSFPPEILQTGSTYENKEKATKQLYQQIQAEADEWLMTISNYMGLDGVRFVSSFNHIPELQADLEKRSKTLNWISTALEKAVASGIITIEEAQDEFRKYLL